MRQIGLVVLSWTTLEMHGDETLGALAGCCREDFGNSGREYMDDDEFDAFQDLEPLPPRSQVPGINSIP